MYTTKMSTVGSASATGSSGGRTTTWASGSAKEGQTDGGDGDEEADGMSMDTNYRDIDERDRYSASAMDEDMDGDGDGMSDNTSLVGFGEGAGSTVSGPIYNRRDFTANSPAVGKSGLSSLLQSGGGATSSTGTAERGSAPSVEAAERIVRDRLDEGEGRKPPLGSPDEAGLGKFYFEDKK